MKTLGSRAVVAAIYLLCRAGIASAADSVPDGVVWTKPTATFWLGETNTELSCQFLGTPIAVYWMKGETPATADILVSWYRGESSGTGVDAGTHDMDSKFSLIFTQPLLEDSGRYICRVSNQDAYLLFNHTDLRVLDPMINIVDTLPAVTAWKGDTTVLPCDFVVDPSRVMWNRESGNGSSLSRRTVLSYSEGTYGVLGEARYGWSNNYALIIRGVEVSDEATFICVVQPKEGEEQLRNETVVTTYARAVEPFVQIGGFAKDCHKEQCILNVTRSQTYFELECRVDGAKPVVDLSWRKGDVANEALQGLDGPAVAAREGTFDTSLTLKRDIHGIPQQGELFTCVAMGIAVNGSANQSVIVHVIPDKRSGPSSAAIICPLLLIVVIAMVVLYLYYARKRNNRFWNGFAMMVRSFGGDGQLSDLDIKRSEIRSYQPPEFQSLETIPRSLNIGLFGVMAAGKSAFVNSVLFALTGKFKHITNEAPVSAEGSQTKFREPIPLTDYIQLLDNKGMKDYNKEWIPELLAQIMGKRGLDPQRKTSEGEEIHVPVLICDIRYAPMNIVGSFVKEFTDQVSTMLGRNIMVVITNMDTLKNAETKREDLARRTNIPEENVWLFENYTGDSHIEDEEKSRRFLNFVSACLEIGERNLRFKERKEKENRGEKGNISKIKGSIV